jgi:Fe-Mn family superoxide dismutase
MKPEDKSAAGRREFLIESGTAAAALAFALTSAGKPAPAQQKTVAMDLPPLPYAQSALAPSISENTISFHYGKHHQTYVNNMLKMVAGTEFATMPLADIIKKTSGKAEQASLFNNAAQVFNHTFYWNSMKPGGGGEPKDRIRDRILASFGSYQKFADEFSNAAATQFGSGCAGWRSAEDHEDRQCRYAYRQRYQAVVDDRCLGACLLSRLPEPARRLYQGIRR